MNDQELNEAAKDALISGEGFMLDGKRIDPKDVYKSEAQMINEAVARKLGRKVYKNAKKHLVFRSHPKIEERVPDYCHSIEAAWEIVTTLGGYWDIIRQTAGTFQVYCSVSGNDSYEKADTAPMAICKAFLKLP